MKVRKLLALIFVLAAALVCLDSLVIEPYAVVLDVTDLKVSDSRLPPNTSVKIVHLTDLHLSSIGFREARITELIKSLRPDAIVMTGDYISSPEELEALHKFLSELRKVSGNVTIVAILGNWDYWSGVPGEVVRVLRNYGVHVLNDSYITLQVGACRITFAGFNSYTGTYEVPNFTVLKQVPDDTPLVVLIHEPSLINYIVKYGVNATVVLAGHCHGGQVKLISAPLFLPEGCEVCYEGACRLDGVFMYVSRGVGTSLFPIRFFSPPEVAVIYLSSSS